MTFGILRDWPLDPEALYSSATISLRVNYFMNSFKFHSFTELICMCIDASKIKFLRCFKSEIIKNFCLENIFTSSYGENNLIGNFNRTGIWGLDKFSTPFTNLLSQTILQILYLPCIYSMLRHFELMCYKIMLWMGVLDMLNLFVMGVLDGWFSITGAVYCSSPSILYIKGCALLGMSKVKLPKIYRYIMSFHYKNDLKKRTIIYR